MQVRGQPATASHGTASSVLALTDTTSSPLSSCFLLESSMETSVDSRGGCWAH